VRTRTLLLLAVACGLAILVAGVVQLLRIAGQDDAADETFHRIGEDVEVGDLTVVVESYDEDGGTAALDVRLGGVDDPDAADGFRLVVPGEDEPLSPIGGENGECGPVTVAAQRCRLSFAVDDAAGGVRVLVVERGEDIARWQLALP
jgi:hypothetical protein